VRSSFVRLAATVLLLGCVVVTSGCSPRTVGVVGVGVDGSGALVGYLTVCEGSLDEVLLYVPDGPVLGAWRAAAPVRDSRHGVSLHVGQRLQPSGAAIQGRNGAHSRKR
jgi:hypothetical protein